MLAELDDTIVAIASPMAGGSRGIVRVSGPRSTEVLSALQIVPSSSSRATATNAAIDLGCPLGIIGARVLCWPNGRSYTGQPSLEFHTYGSLPVLQALVDRIIASGGRAARPGEFTLRAFLNGRLDLTQAEAVLGVIDSEQRGALDHALRQLSGNLSRPLEKARSELLNLLADVEAGLDFVDEDIEFIEDSVLVDRLKEISNVLVETSQQMSLRSESVGTVKVALRGEPNAGKSRLMNAILGREAAIVANVAGTTRDVVLATTELAGVEVHFLDTAGLENPGLDGPLGEISDQSQRRADEAARAADIRLWCVDLSSDDFETVLERVARVSNQVSNSGHDIWVGTKSDLCKIEGTVSESWFLTSAETGDGVDELVGEISNWISDRDQAEFGSSMGTAARCRQSIQLAAKSIADAMTLVQLQHGHEFVSAELRSAVQALGEVTGAVYNDDILDRVFSRFCIGK